MIGTNEKECTCCGACIMKCPKSCISLKTKELGFLYPEVDERLCIHCGLCDRVCPIHHNLFKPYEQKAYAVIHRDAALLADSTSGGAFSAIAEYFLQKCGVIYGCAYNEKLSPVTIRVDCVDSLWRLRGSKYVQGNTGNTFSSAEADLQSGKYVFFTGTPCQIAGLKAYLGCNYDKLFCADLICHGVSSAQYFQDYIHFLEQKDRIRIDSFNFRDKRNHGWIISGSYSGSYSGRHLSSDKKIIKKLFYFNSYYYTYFLTGQTYRESCYTCKYATLPRIGDFTLGDLWGVEALELPFDAQGGCSLVIINTDKGQRLLSGLNIYSQKISLEYAVSHNHQLQSPTMRPPQRDERASEYEHNSIETINHNFKKTHRKVNIIRRLKYAVPNSLKRIILKFCYINKS